MMNFVFLLEARQPDMLEEQEANRYSAMEY